MGGTLQTSAIKHESASTANLTLASDGKTTFGGLIDLGSTGQIKFPATANPSADANTLDDYEEGTWTPVIDSASPGTGRVTTVIYARYTKIGNTVYFYGYFNLSTLGSGGAGGACIKGLPFTSVTGGSYFQGCSINYFDGLNANVVSLGTSIPPNSNQISIYALPAAGKTMAPADFATYITAPLYFIVFGFYVVS